MELHVVVFVLAIVLVASVAQTVAGFGFSLIVMPFLVQVVEVHEAIVLATILALLNTALVTSRVWTHTPRATTGRMIAGAYAGMPLGLLAVLFAPEDGLRVDDLPSAATARRVVQSDDKVCRRCGLNAARDDRPGGQKIRERDGAKIVDERRTHERCAGIEGRHPWDEAELG